MPPRLQLNVPLDGGSKESGTNNSVRDSICFRHHSVVHCSGSILIRMYGTTLTFANEALKTAQGKFFLVNVKGLVTMIGTNWQTTPRSVAKN
jgi:hypothetical protein